MNRRTFLARTGIATVAALLAGKIVLKPEVVPSGGSGTITGRMWDPHTLVAANMYNVKPMDVTRGQRSMAKKVMHGREYGISSSRMAENLVFPDHQITLKGQDQVVARLNLEDAEKRVAKFYGNLHRDV